MRHYGDRFLTGATEISWIEKLVCSRSRQNLVYRTRKKFQLMPGGISSLPASDEKLRLTDVELSGFRRWAVINSFSLHRMFVFAFTEFVHPVVAQLSRTARYGIAAVFAEGVNKSFDVLTIVV